jgi:hypothetical protein
VDEEGFCDLPVSEIWGGEWVVVVLGSGVTVLHGSGIIFFNFKTTF